MIADTTTPSQRTKVNASRFHNPHSIVFVLSTAGITAAIMQTVIVPMVGDLPRLFSTSASNASWVVTTTLVAAAVATPMLGRLGDLFGKRRVLVGCSCSMLVGSLVCALSVSILPMIVGRALQGIGMAMIPLGVSAMRDLLPPEKLNAAIALMSASLGTGAALGLPLSAATIQLTTWQVLFYASAGLSFLVGVLVFLLIPTDKPDSGGSFDYLGGIGLSAGLVSLLLLISKGNDWGWTSVTALSLAAGTVVAFGLWGAWELRTASPLVDLRLAARKRLLLTNIASLIVGFAMYAQSLVIPQLLQAPRGGSAGLGQSMLAAGLWMIPGGIMMLIVSPLSGRLSTAKGPKFSLVLGAAVIAVGYGLGQLLFDTPWGLSITVAVIMTGVAFAYGAMPILIMSDVPASNTAVANGVNTVMRSIGSSASAAVAGAVLAATLTAGVPTESGFRICLAIGGIAAIVAATIAATVPAKPTVV